MHSLAVLVRLLVRSRSPHKAWLGGGGVGFSTIFYAGANERMRITSAGNVLIGTSTDSSYKLDVAGDIRSSNKVYIGTNGCYFQEVLIGGVYEIQVVDSVGNITVLS